MREPGTVDTLCAVCDKPGTHPNHNPDGGIHNFLPRTEPRATLCENAPVVIEGRVMSVSATGDFVNVQILTKSGVTTVAVPAKYVREWKA